MGVRSGFLLLCMAALAKAEEEAPANPADFSVAMMLLATVTFMMSTFYLVNMEDEDLRKAAWQVISATISIFAAVLLFQAVNEMVAYYVLGKTSEETPVREGLGMSGEHFKIFVNFSHAAVWYLLLQGCLAYISGAVSYDDCCKKKEAKEEEPEEEASEEEEEEDGSAEEGSEEEGSETSDEKAEKAELKMKCWATLFGHITGFACINAFGTLQCYLAGESAMSHEITPIGNSTYRSLGAVAIALVVLQIIFKFFDCVRERIAMGDDGRKDKMEELWDDETEETEDDVLGLTISFTSVQVIRFALIGVLPNEEGEVEGEEIHYTNMQAFSLIGVGTAIFFLHVLRESLMKNWQHARRFLRMKVQIKVVAGMIFAWCFFFGTMWLVGIFLRTMHANLGESTISAVILAMSLTFMCYIMIFVLDKLADADWTDDDVDKTLRELIKALGILIGFAWEKSFDAAVVNIASKVFERDHIPACVTKLILSILVCCTVIPAWLWYVLPTLQELGVFAEEDDEEEGKEEGEKVEDEETGGGKGKQLSAPLLADKAELKKLKKAEEERINKMKELQKEIAKNTDTSKKITQDIRNALAEVSKVRAQLGGGS